MAETAAARERLEAIEKQLQPVKTVAAPSTSPRVQDKVVIVTGKSLLLLDSLGGRGLTTSHENTGANSALGIGRASAHQFAQSGAKAVYLCDNDDSNLESVKAELNALHPGVDVHARKFDAANEASVKEVVDDAMATYERLDVFFANAGVAGMPLLFMDLTTEDFIKTMTTNTLRLVYSVYHSLSHPRANTAQPTWF